MTWLKSVGAVVAGFLLVAIGSEATDFALQAVYPAYDVQHGLTTGLYVVALVQRSLWGAAGGFVVARLAPRAALTHALVLGAIGAVLNILGMIVMWRVGAHWYPIALAVTAIPVTLSGALLAGAGKRAT